MEMDFGGAAARRLPVYLVLDVPSSMSGGPIDQVNVSAGGAGVGEALAHLPPPPPGIQVVL